MIIIADACIMVVMFAASCLSAIFRATIIAIKTEHLSDE